MPNYKCTRCDKIFTKKSNYQQHLSRKNRCSQNILQIPSAPSNSFSQVVTNIIESNDTNKEDPEKIIVGAKCNEVDKSNSKILQCNYCMHIFNRSDALKIHLKSRCKVKNNIDKQKEDILIKLLEEQNKQTQIISKLQDRIQELEEGKIQSTVIKNADSINEGTINNNTTNSNTTTNINGNTFNIQILPFEQPDLSYLTENDYKAIIKRGFKSITEFVTRVHFDEKHPQNHSIYISNNRDDRIKYYDGKQWNDGNRKQMIDQMYVDNKSILETKFDELGDKMPERHTKKFDKFINDQQDDEVSDNVKNEMKILLYNKKHIPEGTKEKLEALKKKKKKLKALK